MTLQRLTTALETLKYKFPGTKGKEYAMRMVVMPRVGFTGQGVNLTEEQIQKLDSVTLGYARKDLKISNGSTDSSSTY